MKKILSVTAIAFMLASGAAVAQQSTTTGDPAASDKQMSIEDPAVVGPFFTDESMTTLRGEDEFKAAWSAMSADDQTAMKEQCKSTTSIKLKEFCGTVGNM